MQVKNASKIYTKTSKWVQINLLRYRIPGWKTPLPVKIFWISKIVFKQYKTYYSV